MDNDLFGERIDSCWISPKNSQVRQKIAKLGILILSPTSTLLRYADAITIIVFLSFRHPRLAMYGKSSIHVICFYCWWVYVVLMILCAVHASSLFIVIKHEASSKIDDLKLDEIVMNISNDESYCFHCIQRRVGFPRLKTLVEKQRLRKEENQALRKVRTFVNILLMMNSIVTFLKSSADRDLFLLSLYFLVCESLAESSLRKLHKLFSSSQWSFSSPLLFFSEPLMSSLIKSAR